MFIYQIGNQIITGIAEHSSSINWKGEINQSAQSSRVSFTNRYTIPEATKIKLNGLLSCSRYPSPVYALNDFMKLGGQPYLDIIGYLPDVNTDQCSNQAELEPLWFHTYGMITSIERSYTLDISTANQFDTVELSLEMTINPQWMPLNRFMWFPYYGDDILDTFSLAGLASNINPAPEVTEDADVGGAPLYVSPTGVLSWTYDYNFVFYKRQNLNPMLLYVTSKWDHWTNSVQGYGSSYASADLQYTVQNPYNGEFKYIHSFSNLTSSSDDLKIEVEAEVIPGTLKTFTSTLDITALHNILLLSEYGGTGLTTGMRLYCGNDELVNSFILLNNNYIRSNITGQILVPEWDYETRYPGELLGNKCIVTINDNEASSTDYGYLVLNRAI